MEACIMCRPAAASTDLSRSILVLTWPRLWLEGLEAARSYHFPWRPMGGVKHQMGRADAVQLQQAVRSAQLQHSTPQVCIGPSDVSRCKRRRGAVATLGEW